MYTKKYNDLVHCVNTFDKLDLIWFTNALLDIADNEFYLLNWSHLDYLGEIVCELLWKKCTRVFNNFVEIVAVYYLCLKLWNNFNMNLPLKFVWTILLSIVNQSVHHMN